MTEPNHDMNRLAELLADEALVGLDHADERDFAALSQRFPGIDGHSFGEAASLLQIALLESTATIEPMPTGVRARAESAMREAARSGTAPVRSRSIAEPRLAIRDAPARTPRPAWHGWLAAAACLLIAATAWFTRPVGPGMTPPISTAPSIEDRLASLLQSGEADLVRIAWTVAGDDATAAGYRTGEVVWSDARNEGYMVFEGLAANDPAAEQYQLWIFDATRNEAHPVDGGVFDIASRDARVVVAIDPRVPVREAALFAITVEQPGGVVVSSRERLPLVAPVDRG